MKKSTKFILVAIIILMVVAPLIFLKDAEFGGADGQAEEMIAEIRPEYDPWFESLMVPLSGEIESLLFSLQAVIGASIIAYYFGYKNGIKANASNR